MRPFFLPLMLLIFTIIASVYVVLLLAFCYSWREEEHISTQPQNTNMLVSVIVAFRNEEANLQNLLPSLLSQSYSNCEFVFVNDHSEDKSLEILHSYSDSRIKCLNVEDGFGKKAALQFASKFAHGQIFFFTDADCILPQNWISTTLNIMQKNNYAMVCGPVCFANRQGFWNKIFQLEFLSLLGSTAAGFFIKKPFMCNGANFAIDSNVYKSANLNTKYSSGDDVFLLHYVQEKHKLGFAHNRNSIVETQAPANLKQFFSQRLRWASKVGGYKNKFAIFVSLVIFLMAATLLLAMVMSLFQPIYLVALICLLMIKIIIDTYYIIPVLAFYKKTSLCWAILPLTILHPFYVFIVGICSLFYKPRWKGRRIDVIVS